MSDNLEIERKFIIIDEGEFKQWKQEGRNPDFHIVQAYPRCTRGQEVRVRCKTIYSSSSSTYSVTFKSRGREHVRSYELKIQSESSSQAYDLIRSTDSVIFKDRYELDNGWVVDQFLKNQAGIILAKVKTKDVNMDELPPFAPRFVRLHNEVTGQENYYNANMARC
jgi:CYTH domain-containing protein